MGETVFVFDRNFDHVSKTEDFLNLTKENLCMFLKDDDTSGQELDIFYGVVRYYRFKNTEINC